jgi:hypothetical protein
MKHLSEGEPQQILNALKRALNARTGWDQPPEWGNIYRTDNGRMRCTPLPVPEFMWTQGNGDPKNLLAGFRDIISAPRGANQRNTAATIRASIPDALTGLYIVTEAWAPPPMQQHAILKARERGEPTPRFKDMEGRVETRQACAVDLDMRLYMATQPRSTMVLDGLIDDLTADVRVEGAIPELLFGMLTAIASERISR